MKSSSCIFPGSTCKPRRQLDKCRQHSCTHWIFPLPNFLILPCSIRLSLHWKIDRIVLCSLTLSNLWVNSQLGSILNMEGSHILDSKSLDEFVYNMLEKILFMATTFDRSDHNRFGAHVASVVHFFYCAEIHTVQGFDSYAEANFAKMTFMNIGFFIWERLMKCLVQAEFSRSFMIALESDAKDLSLAESKKSWDSHLLVIFAATICHIWRLSSRWNKMNQRLIDFNDSASQNSIVYERLPETLRPFRLLLLRPTTRKNAPIDCLLCTRSLNNNPQYEALSYTWRDSTQTRDISVNKKFFTITENLFVALRNLRFSLKRRVIWINAICINQNDIPEKNQQIQHMQEIYRQTSEVLIWLGTKTNTTATAIDFMTRIDWWILKEEEPDIYPSQMEFSVLKSILESSVQRENFQTALLAILEFMKRPWWGRVWVSQEYAMATKAHFLCDGLVIELHIFEYFECVWKFCEPLLSEIHREKRLSSFSVYAEILDHAEKLFFLLTKRLSVQESISQQTPVNITYLLSSSKSLKSTDSRNRVYAFLGMTFGENFENELLKPDYSLSTKNVYVNVATHILSTRRILDILLHICHNTTGERQGEDIRFPTKRARQLPSWVPDWSKSWETVPIDTFVFQQEAEPIFQADLDRVSPIPFRFLKHGLILGAKGILVDTISLVGSQAFPTFTPIFETWRKMMSQADDEIYFGKRTVREAFWRTILQDQWRYDNKPSRLDNLVDGHIKFSSCTEEQEARLKSLMDIKLLMYHRSRRFFCTKRGYIGMASLLVRPDDLVVVLLEGTVPFILRKSTFSVGIYDLIDDW